MYVIISGEFEVTFHQRAIGTLGSGEIFGELALLGAGARRSGVAAKSDGVIVPVDRDRFRYLVQYAPSFALIVLRSLAQLLRDMNDTVGLKFVERLDPSELDMGPPSHLEAFRDDSSIRSFAAGASVFEAGDAGDAMFVVVEGRVEVEREDGGTHLTARAGDVFGEMALSDHQPRRSRATALTDARVVPIDAMRFTDLVQNNPNFAIEVMAKMAQRMLEQVDAILD
jgi:CRP-like cAMP-binding protein